MDGKMYFLVTLVGGQLGEIFEKERPFTHKCISLLMPCNQPPPLPLLRWIASGLSWSVHPSVHSMLQQLSPRSATEECGKVDDGQFNVIFNLTHCVSIAACDLAYYTWCIGIPGSCLLFNRTYSADYSPTQASAALSQHSYTMCLPIQ